jgi:hypothetical protein
MAVNGVYEVRASIIFYCAVSQPDLDFDFGLPSGATMPYDLTFEGSTLGYTAGTPVFAANSGDTVYGMNILGLLIMAGSSGTFTFKWSPSTNVSSRNPMFVDAGSYMILTRLA